MSEFGLGVSLRAGVGEQTVVWCDNNEAQHQ